MTYLIDTHTLLWIVTDNPRLSKKVKSLYLNPANRMFVSIACLWEITIKVSLKKLTIPGSVSDFVTDHVQGNDMRLLDITRHHLAVLEHLPWHHRDPFDRLLACQAMHEKAALLSEDAEFDRYPIARIW